MGVLDPFLTDAFAFSYRYALKRLEARSTQHVEVEAEMAVGKVKWFNDEKGWGFIKQDEGPDVFVHYSQIAGEGRRRLFEDELVEFEIKEGPKGLQAVNVLRPQGASAQA